MNKNKFSDRQGMDGLKQAEGVPVAPEMEGLPKPNVKLLTD